MGQCESIPDTYLGIEIPASEHAPPNCLSVLNSKKTKQRYKHVSQELIEFFNNEADDYKRHANIDGDYYDKHAYSLYAIKRECAGRDPDHKQWPELQDELQESDVLIPRWDHIYEYILYKSYALIFQGERVLSYREREYVSLLLYDCMVCITNIPDSLEPEALDIASFLCRLSKWETTC